MSTPDDAAADRSVMLVRVAAYVDAPVEDVVALLGAEGSSVLDHALMQALRTDGRAHVAAVTVTPGPRVARCTASAQLAWRATTPESHALAGTAALRVLTVRGGAVPRTELLLEVDPDRIQADRSTVVVRREVAARVARRFLDALTDRLSQVAA